MKISVADARALVEALTKGIDYAMAHGHHEFDLLTTVQVLDDQARAELEAAIQAARKAGA